MTDHYEERTDALESDIRRTRERMGEDIEALGDKLSPSRIKDRAKETVKRKTREAGQSLIRSARENPIPAAMVAVGLTWLMRVRKKGNGEAFYDEFEGLGEGTQPSVKDKVQNIAGAAGETVEHIRERAADKARRTSYDLRRFYEENPLIGAAGVLVLGAVVGAILPHTEKEDRIMGRARDELVDQAEGVVDQAKHTIEEKMSETPQDAGQPAVR